MSPAAVPGRALGAYVLPGGVTDSSRASGQARAAERIGLATLWISERLGFRDLGAVAGAIGQATTTMRIGSAVTPFQTRHPAVLASLASTLQSLTKGRFLLGLGRGGSWLTGLGVMPTASAAMVVDTASILRRLWAGQTVTYHGPAGRYPAMRLEGLPAVAPPPLLMAALGPRSLRLAGQHFDGVILPAFLTPRAVEQMTSTTRDAAAAAGRDPRDVRVYATVITMASPAPDDLDILAGRAVTYLQPPVHGERILHLNGWDLAPLTRLRAHPLIAGLGGALADQAYSPRDLATVGQLIPRHWLTSSTAAGSPRRCAERLAEYLEAGADELILHGTPPDRLEPAVTAYRRWTASGDPAQRPAGPD